MQKTLRSFAFLGVVLASTHASFARADGFACQEGNNPLRILPLGDSITEGYINSSTYRPSLDQRLKARNLVFDFVGTQNKCSYGSVMCGSYDADHEGHSGFRADEIAAQLPGWMQSANYVPDLVILHVGTNDIHQGQDIPSTLTEIESIVQALRARCSSVGIVLAKIIPMIDTQEHSAKVLLLNQGLDSLAGQLRTQGPIALVDLHQGYSNDWFLDGIHPSEDGARFMAERIEAGIVQLLSMPSSLDAGVDASVDANTDASRDASLGLPDTSFDARSDSGMRKRAPEACSFDARRAPFHCLWSSLGFVILARIAQRTRCLKKQES